VEEAVVETAGLLLDKWATRRKSAD
jgi:hypothetical protein